MRVIVRDGGLDIVQGTYLICMLATKAQKTVIGFGAVFVIGRYAYPKVVASRCGRIVCEVMWFNSSSQTFGGGVW